MPIKLPLTPKKETYEDLITACLVGLGYFVEANLHLRDNTTEILELDVVATPIKSPVDGVILFDAKSGKSGLADVFKLFGWRTFLQIPKACVVRPQSPDDDKIDAFRSVERQTNVSTATVNLDDFDLSCFESQQDDLGDDVRDVIIAQAWLGRIGKRLCIQAFTPLTKRQDLKLSAVARDYRWAVEQSFFVRRPLDRARAIYKAFHNAGCITGRIIEEMASLDKKKAPDSIWNEIRDTANRKELQFCLMLEHTARLRVIKNSLIHLIEREAHGESKTMVTESLFAEWTMPRSFRDGIARMQECEYRNRLPYLWQLFIEVFGGFYSLKSEGDLQLLSSATGIPLRDVANCIHMYEVFFPTPNGWFYDKKGEIRIMKNVPTVYHGTGALLRQTLFSTPSYVKMHSKAGWLVHKWGQALQSMLEPELTRN